MIIQTLHFGEVDIDDNNILTFEDGIPGFENIKKYAVLSDPQTDSPFLWIQSVEESYPAITVISPFEIISEYEFDISESTVEMLEIKDPSDVVVYVVVVIPDDITKMTANMKAPIIINTANNRGCQMIMDNSEYQIKHYILEELLKQQVESSAVKEDK